VAGRLPDAIRADGIEVIDLPISPRSFWYAVRLPLQTGYDEMEMAVKMFSAGCEEQARALASEVYRRGVSVIVADYLFFPAYLAARVAGVPFVTLYHSALPFPVEGAPPFGSGLLAGSPSDPAWQRASRRFEAIAGWLTKRTAQACRSLGVDPPEEALLHPYSSTLNILATTEVLEPGLRPLAGPVLFAGPCIEPRPDERDDDPALQALLPGRRRVYVSLGTVFNERPGIFRTLLRGLDRDDVQVIVSAGASYKKLSKQAPSRNASIFPRVPQLKMLQRVDAVVTHGGNNTTQETLAAGRPMMVVPFGGDQLENACRVQRLGVGVAVPPRKLSVASVREALDRLLFDARLQTRAREVSAALVGCDGVGRSVEAILGVADAVRGVDK
jgi:MGT family glycosyltransferase